ncbi:MAG: ABC transporter ATP-binding protein [Gemmatimonadota bacterium]|nr:ABC transporter ATP-binding protein [Gemmatimonadota bacterium]
MGEPFLELRGLTKHFTGHAAVQDLSLAVPRGAVLALLGPSGSGKTTTLRLLAGFDRPDAGSILVEGRDVTRLPSAARRCGMVFQHYALFPHLTVGENVAFGIQQRPDRDERVRTMLRLVDLAGFERRTIDALSGGQQQRVALARALAPEPRVLLLDEPLSNLDPALRERTRRELRAALRAVGITTVLVTHEQEEAFALGDLIAVLREGRLEQVGTGPDLYERPATQFVATFVGRASVVPGTMADPTHAQVAPAVVWPVRTALPVTPGTAVSVVVRPDALRLAEAGLRGTVRDKRYLGGGALFHVETEVGRIEIEAPVAAAAVGAVVHVVATTGHAFPAES